MSRENNHTNQNDDNNNSSILSEPDSPISLPKKMALLVLSEDNQIGHQNVLFEDDYEICGTVQRHEAPTSCDSRRNAEKSNMDAKGNIPIIEDKCISASRANLNKKKQSTEPLSSFYADQLIPKIAQDYDKIELDNQSINKLNKQNKISSETNIYSLSPIKYDSFVATLPNKTANKEILESDVTIMAGDYDEHMLTSSFGSIIFDAKKIRTSTHIGELVTSWNGESAVDKETYRPRVIRSRSWCAHQPEDEGKANSEIRLLRERLLRTQAHPQPTAIRHFTHGQRLTLVSLALVDFMSFCSMSVMAPFFPKEAAEKGMSESVSGFVFSFYALIMFLSSPVFGKLLPAIGAKFLFMSGMFVAGACNILFGTLEYIEDYELFTLFCFLIRGLEALGASAYSTASYVFVVNTFPDNIGSVLGILETFVGLGMSIGPAVGGLLYSVGGFGLPFYVLGAAMLVALPVNCCLLVADEDYTLGSKSGSILSLFKVPSVVITGLVIVVVSCTWAFLDPTLEPHLRKFGLSPQQIGLIFLLFSALYGIFSPIWGWLADRVQNHWCMMVWGLLLCSVGLLILGPSPIFPEVEGVLWMDLLGLSILGVSVALTLLPTFQGVLSSSIEEGGCVAALSTYSVVAGVWSCCYSLGEVIGPALGGAVAHRYGFPLCSTVMAAMCFTMAIVTLTFFSIKDSNKLSVVSVSLSDSNTGSDTTWRSVSPHHTPQATRRATQQDTQPLLAGDPQTSRAYGATEKCEETEVRGPKKSFSSPNMITNILMFKFLTRSQPFKPSDKSKTSKCNNDALCSNPNYANNDSGYTNLIKNDQDEGILLKKGGTGLLPNLEGFPYGASNEEVRKPSVDLMKYTLDKVKYYGETRRRDSQDLTLDRNQVTDIRGTVHLSTSGACEV